VYKTVLSLISQKLTSQSMMNMALNRSVLQKEQFQSPNCIHRAPTMAMPLFYGGIVPTVQIGTLCAVRTLELFPLVNNSNENMEKAPHDDLQTFLSWIPARYDAIKTWAMEWPILIHEKWRISKHSEHHQITHDSRDLLRRLSDHNFINCTKNLPLTVSSVACHRCWV
jgi:hypothetical protein